MSIVYPHIIAADGGGFDFNSIAPFVTAIGGIVLGVLGVSHNRKNTEMRDHQGTISSIIQGYTSQVEGYSKIVASLQSEVARMNREIQEERDTWHEESEHAAEKWSKERAHYEEVIADLKERVDQESEEVE